MNTLEEHGRILKESLEKKSAFWGMTQNQGS